MELTNKSILVTGASGLIGSNLVETLLKSDCGKVIAMGRNREKLEKNLTAGGGNCRA